MTNDQKEFIELTRRAIRGASTIAYPHLCALREDDFDESADTVLRFALTNAITPQEAMPHVESYLSEN